MTKRRVTAQGAPSTASAIRPVADAATRAETATTRCAGKRSARLSAADETAPATNPTCTATVSRVAWNELISQSRRRAGTTAEAENQQASTSTCTSAIRASCRRAAGRASASVAAPGELTAGAPRQVPATAPRAARAASRSSTTSEHAARKRSMLAPGVVSPK